MAGLYGYRWQRYRKRYLEAHPLCVMHEQMGKVVPATVVDHIQPHRGNEESFWDEANHQALCKRCHDSHKQRQEKSGTRVGCDISGIPLDNAHHWRK